MMECWDTENPLFRQLSTLIALRRRNQALTHGSHQQRYITESVYAYSRHYRDHSVLVAMNQGADATITVPDCGLPDGSYRCLISGQDVEVREGGIHDLPLPGGSVRVLERQGQRVHGPVVGVFQLNGYVTKPGESLAITGCCPELGGWDHARAYGLEYVNANTWIGEVPFDASAGSLIHYKFIVRTGGEAVVENIVSRRFVLPDRGRVKFDCIWGDD
jgi:cyclomaltodextrin glucanotransferase